MAKPCRQFTLKNNPCVLYAGRRRANDKMWSVSECVSRLLLAVFELFDYSGSVAPVPQGVVGRSDLKAVVTFPQPLRGELVSGKRAATVESQRRTVGR